MQDLISLHDLTAEEVKELLELGIKLKAEKKAGIEHHILKGKTLGMIFTKSSTRTRVSFEVGMTQLGGYPLFLSSNDIQLGRGETIYDTAKVLERMLDGIMIRTYAHQDVLDLAEHANIPVINALTDLLHPCQVLADLMTIREIKGSFEGLKMCYIGDGNNMANSLITGCIKVGMNVAAACPGGYKPDKTVLEYARSTGRFVLTDNPMEAAAGADVLITDVWASMGQEGETEKRRAAFRGYQINDDIMAAANDKAIVLHCLPAHREEEITSKVFEEHASEIFEEAENRLHAQKAVMVKLMAD